MASWIVGVAIGTSRYGLRCLHVNIDSWSSRTRISVVGSGQCSSNSHSQRGNVVLHLSRNSGEAYAGMAGLDLRLPRAAWR